MYLAARRLAGDQYPGSGPSLQDRPWSLRQVGAADLAASYVIEQGRQAGHGGGSAGIGLPQCSAVWRGAGQTPCSALRAAKTAKKFRGICCAAARDDRILPLIFQAILDPCPLVRFATSPSSPTL